MGCERQSVPRCQECAVSDAQSRHREGTRTIDTRIAEIDRWPRTGVIVEVQAQLSADEALVLFLDIDNRFKPLPEGTFIWFVTKSGVRWVRSDFGIAALSCDLAALRCGLDARAWDGSGAETCAKALGIPLDKVLGSKQPLPFDHPRAYKLYSSLLVEMHELIKPDANPPRAGVGL
jgi:hypothetical protein